MSLKEKICYSDFPEKIDEVSQDCRSLQQSMLNINLSNGLTIESLTRKLRGVINLNRESLNFEDFSENLESETKSNLNSIKKALKKHNSISILDKTQNKKILAPITSDPVKEEYIAKYYGYTKSMVVNDNREIIDNKGLFIDTQNVREE